MTEIYCKIQCDNTTLATLHLTLRQAQNDITKVLVDTGGKDYDIAVTAESGSIDVRCRVSDEVDLADLVTRCAKLGLRVD